MSRPAIVWFRQDLRLSDNPALAAALARGGPVICLYVLDETPPWPLGGAARWWLHGSLSALGASIAERGGALVLRRGQADAALDDIIARSGAEAVFWNRCYEPAAIARDGAIKAALRGHGVVAESSNAALLTEPWAVKTKSGGFFQVFTPFWRALRAEAAVPVPAPAPQRIPAPPQPLASDRLEDWALRPLRPDWAGGLREAWTPGEAAAQAQLERFIDEALARYASARDLPAEAVTSRLSPYLHWGEISPRQAWHAAAAAAAGSAGALNRSAEKFQSELAWREFAHHLLFHVPTLPERPWRAEFERFPWRPDARALAAWHRGRTGYPIVDAGMRELWATGWMHNRVRMIAASFLVKHLLLPWQDGARWFWDTLVDADLANNSASWQWVAGCGADAAPYFRIFNPVLQGEKFDPDGRYVRRWVPELARLPDPWLHRPWSAPAETLAQAGVALGRTYPAPLVDLAAARDRALSAFRGLRDAA
ncbi:MAG: deoxyribodipyrimidine photo-lyase [Alphaproteobacteria bacterium]|nr:deoxyribodipyrimidine photo-lyase [Alphaproteobacteria bacterium]